MLRNGATVLGQVLETNGVNFWLYSACTNVGEHDKAVNITPVLVFIAQNNYLALNLCYLSSKRSCFMSNTLKEFIFQELIHVENPAAFGEQDDLLEAGLDSMGIMRLMLFIEEELGVSLPDEEIEPDNLQTLQRLQAWIARHR